MRIPLTKLAFGLFASLGMLMLLILVAVRATPSSGLVFGQFTETGRRTWVYLDPFRERRIERPFALHDEAATEPPKSGPDSPGEAVQIVPHVRGGGVNLFARAADGTETPLTGAAGGRSNTFPLWSPDGQWISFISTGPQASTELYLVRPDGTELRRVYRHTGTLTLRGLRWLALPEAGFQPWLMLAALGLALTGLLTARRAA